MDTPVRHSDLESQKRLERHVRLDRAGATLSLVCAVHCLAMPALLAAFPVLSNYFLFGESLEFGLSLSMCLIATGSVVWGYLAHRKKKVLGLLILGITIFILAKTVLSGNGEVAGMVGAGLLLAATHVINSHYSKQCSHEAH